MPLSLRFGGGCDACRAGVARRPRTGAPVVVFRQPATLGRAHSRAVFVSCDSAGSARHARSRPRLCAVSLGQCMERRRCRYDSAAAATLDWSRPLVHAPSPDGRHCGWSVPAGHDAWLRPLVCLLILERRRCCDSLGTATLHPARLCAASSPDRCHRACVLAGRDAWSRPLVRRRLFGPAPLLYCDSAGPAPVVATPACVPHSSLRNGATVPVLAGREA